MAAAAEAELKHRCQLAQYLLPEWVPSKWLTLFTQVGRRLRLHVLLLRHVEARDVEARDVCLAPGAWCSAGVHMCVCACGRAWEGSLTRTCVGSDCACARACACRAHPTQAWEGDVTMTLPNAMWHLGKAITNPTTEELVRSVKVWAQRRSESARVR